MKKCILISFITLLMFSCVTNNNSTNKTGWSDYAAVVVKDYNVVGHIRVESNEKKIVSVLSLTTKNTGSKVTYDMLLAEAIKLGADDIINVRIDTHLLSERSIFDRITGYTEDKMYIGNALAITYKAPVGDGYSDSTTEDSGMDKPTSIFSLF